MKIKYVNIMLSALLLTSFVIFGCSGDAKDDPNAQMMQHRGSMMGGSLQHDGNE